MTTTFQKRQKEMKRLDKQREKAARRAQRKLDKRAEKENPTGNKDANDIQWDSQDPNSSDPNAHGTDPQGGAA
jgi:hypothetical protein